MNACRLKDPEGKVSAPGNTGEVTAYFESTALNWHAMYTQKSVWADIYQDRLSRVLSWAHKLRLPEEAKILDVGCGAGFAAIALAKLGHIVAATDVAQRMLDLTQRNAALAGVEERVHAALGDIYDLNFPGDTFDLALSIGVIPWLLSPGPALQELARVLKPGGHLLITADNRWRLVRLLDPATSPALHPAKKLVRKILFPLKRSAPEPAGVTSHQHSFAEIDPLLVSAGLRRLHFETFGFGPFMFFYKKFLPERLGIAVNRTLQRVVDWHMPLIRSTGAQFLILARKID